MRGWLAGPPFWIAVHELKKTRPCRWTISGGALPCSVEHDQHPVVWRAYLPWYDEKYRCRGVWVSTPLKEYLSTLPAHCPIVLSRTKADKSPIDVTADEMRLTKYVDSPSRVWPADPSPTLLTMWKDLELSQWCRDQDGHGSVPTETPAQRAIAAELAAHLAADAGGDGGDTGVSPASRNEAFARAVKATAGAKNGKH